MLKSYHGQAMFMQAKRTAPIDTEGPSFLNLSGVQAAVEVRPLRGGRHGGKPRSLTSPFETR